MTTKKTPDGIVAGRHQDLFQALVETSQDLIWQCDSQGRYSYLNPAWETTFGYKTEEMLGKKFSDFQTPEMALRDTEEFKRLMKGNTVRGLETIHLSKSGQEIHLVFNAKFTQNENGEIIGTWGTAHDITERRRTEESLRLSERRFRLQYYHLPIPTFTWQSKEQDFELIGYNLAGETLTKGAVARLVGIKASVFFNDYEGVFGDMLDCFREKKVRNREIEYCYKLINEIQNLRFTYVFVEPDLIMVHSENITELKQAAFNLRESESRFRSVFEQSSVGSVFVGFDKRFIKCNPAFCSFIGYEEDDLIGKAISDITYPDDVEIGTIELKRIAEGKQDSFSAQKRYLRKDGAVVWGEVSVSLVRDATGKPLYFLPIIKDITDRKKAEDDHRKYEQQIQQSQKLESLGLLAGGIAHDFNNILAMIFGFIDMAIRKSNEDSVKGSLNKSLAAMDRARALTGQLLTFAKGGLPVRKIGRLFPFVQETTQFALSGSNVAPRFDIEQNLWPANFDQNQLGQVIDNIVINAHQAMPMGGTLEITAKNVVLGDKGHVTLPKGNYVRISIKDSGIGIPHDMLPRIFDPFFTTKAKGHGLGLATCYSIVKRHNGCIDVDSEPGKGSTFHVYLPAADGSITPTRTNLTPLGKGNGTFLVMDDEEHILEVTQDMLESLGYTIVCKTDGKAAVAFVTEELKAHRALAGIILDLTIPGGMGGKEAVLEIRKLCPDTPIFVSSGYAEDPVMAKPKEYGFTASICKPFRMDELSEILGKHLIKQP